MVDDICNLAGNAGSFASYLACKLGTMIFLLADAVGGKSIGGDDVGSCLDVETMNVRNDLWSGQTQHVVVTHKRHAPILEPPFVEALRRQSESLNPRTHRTIHYQDALSKTIPDFLKLLFHFGCKGNTLIDN